VTHH